MANNLVSRPIFLDGVMGAASGPVTVRKVLWVGPSTLAHTFVITDGAATPTTLLQSSCAAADVSGVQQFSFDIPVRWKQYKLTTLASGVLLIYGD